MSLVVTILLAAAVMTALAFFMGLVLGWANKAFHVPIDPKLHAVNEALPGANCGGCGYIGCGDYAEAVVENGESITKCPVGGDACAADLANIMGVELDGGWPTRPVVHCSATWEQRLQRVAYEGEKTCQAANLINVQGCTFGCLGYGDCDVSCEYDAIHVIDGLATVDYDRCVGCGACAKACPRNIISVVPFKAERILAVRCANSDFGKEVSSICTVGCIGCSACAKVHDAINMDGKLPVINYDAYEAEDDFALPIDKCSRESLIWIGKPSAADLVAAANDPLDGRVEVDFKSTVDDTEWRG